MPKDLTQALFPSRIAKDITFCNRTIEKKRIHNNIKNVQHTLIISPRRYGKTSLTLQVLREAKVPYSYIQFFNAFTDEIVQKRFMDGLQELFNQLIPKTKKALLKFTELIHHATASLSLKGINVEIDVKPLSTSPIDSIKGLLRDIDQILKKKNEKAVFFFDEFQDIVQSDISDELQSMMRDFAQHTDHLTFIVSGSHRHMLLKIFDDSNKPFYKLFDRIDLGRIKKEEYESFIQKLALDHWQEKLSEAVINEILHLTECHAYYVNRLCAKLWNLENIPSLKDLQSTWSELVEEEFGSVANDISALTKNQRIVLQALSRFPLLKEPSSTHFLQKVGLSPRSTKIALDALENTDHIEHLPEGFRVIDPVIRHILNE